MRSMREFIERVRRVLDEPAVLPFSKKIRGKIGHGFHHLGITYIHHSHIPPRESAFIRLSKRQKQITVLLAFVIGLGLLFFWHTVLTVLIAALTCIYFLDLLFHFFLIFKSFKNHPEIVITPKELKRVKERNLPLYTILCPLYREEAVVAQFARAMEKLDYPKRKLQVLLLTEEDDSETRLAIKKLHLPCYFKEITVPHSLPKTKPKALNYGLTFAKGMYVSVFDAEDIPEASQLKKSVIAFSKSDKKTICLQAKLHFYNSHHTLVTKVFSAEYALWFDLILSGLYSLDSLIPLGGTSNHFRTSDLRLLGGWDSFNVTEDCDLGVRIVKSGHKTALLDSLTFEEANSRIGAWLVQRSRWIKGYIQTYFVHSRSWRQLVGNGSLRNGIIFHFVIGGKIATTFINPLMWAITITYFAARPIVGTFIESFYPTPVLYMGLFSIVFGNFLYGYAYMIGCAKREQERLIKYAYLVPFYWLGMSVAAWYALYQLVRRPFFWAKTMHGWHLTIVVKAHVSWMQRLGISQIPAYVGVLTSKVSFVMVTTIAGSFLNFAFNAFAGRVLSFEQFGIVTLISSLTYLLGFFENALASAVTAKVGYLSTRYGNRIAYGFLKQYRLRIFNIALGATLLWLLILPQISIFFKLPHLLPLFLFTPAIIGGFMVTMNRGFLWGVFGLGAIGILTLVETAGKLGLGVLFATTSHASLVYLSIPASIIVTSALSFFWTKGKGVSGKTALTTEFPRQFFTAALLTHLSTSAFITLDMVMVKHLFDPVAAGQYALLALTGKIIFFLGAIPHSLIISLVSRGRGVGQNTQITFYKIFSITAAVVGIAFILVGPLGFVFVPFLFGEKTSAIIPYLTRYTLSISLFTLATSIVIYQLARKKYQFSFLSLFATLALVLLFPLSSGSLVSATNLMLSISAIYFLAVVALYSIRIEGKFLLRGIVDFLDAFAPLSKENVTPGKKRILIFNWRDIRHCYAGGAEVYIHEIAKRWVESGNRVVLFCGNDGKCPRYEVIDGVRVYRRGGFYLVYLWAFIYYVVRFRGRFDVIIDSQNGIPFFTPLYAKESVYCLMFHVHQEVFRRSLPYVLAMIARILEKDLMPRVYRDSRFITISRSSKLEMKKLGINGTGISVVNPGIDTAKLRPGNKSRRPVVLYVGRLKQYKSLDVIISCAKNILNRFPSVRFVIAGDGEERERLQRLAVKLGVGKNIFFMGKVTNEQKIRLYQKAWVFVNPSMMEGWGITTIEANACGTPVVASDVPGLRDSVHNPTSGLLVPHGDEAKFADTIVKMIGDERLRRKLSQGAQLWAAQFDWDKSATKSLRILRA